MGNRIGLRQLRAFQAVMTTGSVTLAADRLNLTQPAISKQLAALENALKIKLFDRRSGSAMTPTSDGIVYFKAIEATLSGIDRLHDIAQEITTLRRKRLSIAATPPLINSAPIMAAVKHFRAKNPDVQISLEPRHRLEIEDWVASRQIDFGLALMPVDNPLLKSMPLIETKAVAVVSRSHKFAGRWEIGPEDVDEETVILPSRQPLRTRIDRTLAEENASMRVDIESSSAITCCRMAAANIGVAVCDPFSPTAYSPSDVHVMSWRPPVSLTYGVLTSRASELSQVAAAFFGEVQRAFQTMDSLQMGQSASYSIIE